MLQICMGETGECLVVKNVEHVALPVLLGSFFFHYLVKRIFPAEGKVVQYNSQPLPIRIVQEASVNSHITTKTISVSDCSVLAVETEEKEQNVVITRAATLNPMSEVPVCQQESVIMYKVIRVSSDNNIRACRFAESWTSALEGRFQS